MFLPPYRPDLNPIEQAFAKLKHALRKAKERTVEALWNRIGQHSSQPFPKEERKNYFIKAGWTGLMS